MSKSRYLTFLSFFLLMGNTLVSQECEHLEKKIETTREEGPRDQLGILYKQLGDCHAKQDDEKQAVVAYQQALSYPFDSLDISDRLDAIKYLIEHHQPAVANAELDKILFHDPDNQQARILLAQTDSTEAPTLSNAANTAINGTNGTCQKIIESIQDAEERGYKGRLGYLYKQLGDCYAQEYNTESALQAYTQAISYPYDALYAKARIQIADYLGTNGRTNQAIDELDEILDHEPDNTLAMILMAKFLSWDEDYKNAEKYIDEVLEKDPTNFQARLIKANIYTWSGKPQSAIPIYKQVLKQNSLTQEERFEANHGLTLAYHDMGQYDLAERNLQFIEPQTPSQARKKERLAYAVQQEDVSPTPVQATPPPQTAPPTQPTPVEEAICESYLQKIAEAQKEKKQGELSHLYKHLGKCYNRNGQRELAANAYETAFSFPYGTLSLSSRIEMAEFLGNFDRYNIAIIQLEKVLKDDPKNTSAQILLARFLAWRDQEGDLQEAEFYIEQALAKEPNNKLALLTKSLILVSTYRADQAIPILTDLLSKEIILNQEESFEARYLLAVAYLELHQLIAAESNALILEPKFGFQETKKQRVLTKIEKAKKTHPLADELDEIINEKLQFASQMLRKRCLGPAYFEVYQALRLDPCNLDSHFILGQILFVDDDYCGALKQADYILCRDPCNIDALILKGNILRRKRDFPGSSCAFEQALCQEPENFDARVGFAWLYLGRDNPVVACHLAQGTPVKEDYQISDMNSLYWDIVTGPIFGIDYSRYLDSDRVRTDDYFVRAIHYYQDWKFDVFYRHVYASQPVAGERGIELVQRADAGGVGVKKMWSPWLDTGGGIGYADTDQGNYVTGDLIANIRTHCGNWELGSVYDIFPYTAAAIFFEIRTWTNYISYLNVLSGRWTVGGDYNYTYYTDSNHSNRVDLWAEYKLLDCICWYVLADYRFKYLNFESQIISPFVVPGIFGGHGYFDPFDFYGNEVGISLNMEVKKINLYIRPYTAYVTYESFGRHNGMILAGEANIEYFFTNKVAFGLGIEAGRWPLRDLKYNYTILSANLTWGF